MGTLIANKPDVLKEVEAIVDREFARPREAAAALTTTVVRTTPPQTVALRVPEEIQVA
jgi:hypothetical protein